MGLPDEEAQKDFKHMVGKESVDILHYEGNQKLFRYVEMEKLLFMMTKNALPLTRMTLFDDPYEGSYPEKFLQIEEEALRRELKGMKPRAYREDKEGFIRKSKEMEWNWRRNYFVSCWHANDSESEAMWRRYSSYHKGMAIQTDLNTLISELPRDYDNQGFESGISVGEVRYTDFDNPDMSLYYPGFAKQYLLKRKAFETEREVRVFIHPNPGWGTST